MMKEKEKDDMENMESAASDATCGQPPSDPRTDQPSQRPSAVQNSQWNTVY